MKAPKAGSTVGACGSLTLFLAGAAVAAPPPGPTPIPCQTGSCGTAAQSFVQYGTAGASFSGTTVNITQSTNKAILNWASFNIANGYTVNFLQPSATAAILNNIWSANPSVIAGRLNANGQVYLVNQNGIVFDKGAQIDVAGLTASTLTLPSTTFENGILAANTASTAPPVFVAPATGTAGAIDVNAGASLTAADGGRILLLGSAVTNSGTISTPDGQTILGAATNNVYLAASTNAALRGLLIEVDGGGTTGTVINHGEITAARGNITLAGLVVNQEGMLSATTSVSANGSIYLVAGDASPTSNYYYANPHDPANNPTAFGGLTPSNGGTLILAPGSVTQVLPDATDTGTLTEPQRAGFIPSQVDLAGRFVALEGNASVHVPGGAVNAYASADPYNIINSPTLPIADGGSIYISSSSTIDVSGLANVSVPVTQNLVQVTLETDDLQNDPLLRTGFLHGAKVTVDIRDPPTLFDVTPYADNIGSTVEQVLSQAGTIYLHATGSVITRAGATLNVSGGSIAWQGGLGPSTTNLMAANGRVFNISTAPNDIEYTGIANSYSYTDPTWGTTTKGNGQSYYPGYIQGVAAGTITAAAPEVYLLGSMLGQTAAGVYQRTPASLAPGGTLVVGCGACTISSRELVNYGLDGGATFANAVADTLNANVVADGYVVGSTSIPAVTSLSPAQLTSNGFTAIDVYSNGPVTLPAGTNIALAANGGLGIKSATSIAIDGNIDAPGGNVSLQTVSSVDLLPHNISVGPGATIDVSGIWTNDSPVVTLQPGTAPTVVNAGSVALNAAGNVNLGAGSTINASGGGWMNEYDKLTEGSAGSISLAATFSLGASTPATDPYTGSIDFGAGSQLKGGSLKAGQGGTLALQSGSVTVDAIAAGTPGELLLQPGFFVQGGFANYKITGENDVIIGSLLDTNDRYPVTVAPLQQTLVFTQNSLLQPTGTPLASFTQLQTLPLSLRSPASISFSATASDRSGAEIGDVTLAQDASIVTDPGASVLLAANGYNGDLRVFGTVLAPAGNITLQLENPQNPLQSGVDPGYIAGQEILLGPQAVLAAPGFAELNVLNPLGYTEGSVLPGGTVSLLANKGYVQTDYGSLVNVSGTVATLFVAGAHGLTQTTEAANAGTINIDAREGIVLQGNLLAQPASLNGAAFPGAAGGTLNVVLGYNYSDSGSSGTGSANESGGSVYPTATRILTLAGIGTNGSPAVPPSNQLQSGTGVIDVSTIEAGGFANVALSSADTIAFAGTLALNANASLVLDAPVFVGSPLSHATLSAPYVAVGNYLNNVDYYDVGYASPNAPAVLDPVTGTAVLDVNAQLIDIRGISGWSGFAQENFTSAGDIRFVAGENAILAPPAINVPGNPSFEGGFITSAMLDLRAAQLYPTTATAFAIDDSPSTSSSAAPAATQVTIGSSLPTTSPTPATPLSAGGSLIINATDIDQFGVLRAPLGQLALNGVSIVDAEGNLVTPGSVTLEGGSLTSVSAAGLLIPYGTTVNGTQWTYTPAVGYTDIVTQPPAKQISLTGPNVAVDGAAKLDLSGGGDLYAYEFIAGEGGAVDVLNPANLPATAHPAGTTVYTYAILPTLGSSFAPADAQYLQGSSVAANQTITLSGVPGLAAGTYALLPAPYALLPGAYAVQVVQANSNLAPGSSVAQPGGAYEVAARFGVAGTNILSSLTSTVLVASDATVRTQSQYTDSYANAFFSSAAVASNSVAPPLPADAGQLLLSATNQLNFTGSVDFATGSFTTTNANGTTATQQGLGGDVGITAPNIVVVNPTGPQTQFPAGTVQVNVQQLNNLDAQTLIIGGSSTTTSAGDQINVGATQTVDLKNTIPLSAPEIILVAQDGVTIDANAQITTTAAGSSAAKASAQTLPALLLPGGGALLRVSNGAAATLTVDPTTLPTPPTGTLAIGAGATVEAAGSLLLYGTVNTSIAPGAQIAAPSVSLYSSAVNLGDAPAGAPGLTLTSQLLGNLKGLTDLTIGSDSTIDFYGALQLGTPSSSTPDLQSISLDAAGLGGYGGGDKILQANSITLTNSSGSPAAFASAPDGTGALELIASGGKALQSTGAGTGTGGTPTGPGQITLAATSNTVSGFSALDLRASGDIVGSGSGTLTVASSGAVPVNLTSVSIIGAAGSDQSIVTTGAVTIAGSAPNGVTLPSAGLGAALAIQGSSITQNGTLEFPAGLVSLTATSGDLILGKGSVTSAAGVVQGYTVTSAVAAGGHIDLAAQAGNVTLDAGATVDVAGASSTGAQAVNGDAGSLSVSAPLGTFGFDGATLKGGAATGQSQGSFTLDEGTGLGGAGFAALDKLLGGSGFTGAVDLRTRSDASVTIATAVQAASFELTVDSGSIEVAGTGAINTSGGTPQNADGGSIALWAGTGLTLDAGAHLLANAGTVGPAGANGAALLPTGGNITLGTSSGTLAIAGGTPQNPTTISMQGGGAAATDGTLTLRAPRTADDTNVQIQIQNAPSLDLVTRNPVVIEGFKTYSATDLGGTDAGCGSGGSCDIADLNGMLYTDAATFVGNSPAIAAGLGLPNVQIRPGIEVDSPGDLVLDNTSAAWDLASWNAALGAPVNLTLRAAGNLILEASLSDGFTSNGGAVAAWTFGEPGTATGSASYTLTAGADLSSANPLAVIVQPAPATSVGAPPNAGNVILTPGNLIRTGSGNISIAAGGDVLLGYGVGDTNGNLYDNGTLQVAESDPLTSAIYTAGVPSVLTPAQALLFIPDTPVRGRGGSSPAPDYPMDGGNISVSAGDDIRSAVSSQLISDWLWRRGPVLGVAASPSVNSSWWIMFNDFEQGFGVLGGGNLSLTAGRDMVNTSAVVPTTGRLLLAAGGTPVASDLLLTGGGNLQVQAGGNIVSGVFEDDWGSASIIAGGALTSSTDSTLGQAITPAQLQQLSSAPPALSTELYPILAVGNGAFDVSARTGIAIDAVTNSTTLPLTSANTSLNSQSTGQFADAAFFAYAPTANPGTLNLVSAGGSVTLAKDPAGNLPLAVLSAQSVFYENSPGVTDTLSTLPSTVNVASLSGDIDLGDATLAQTVPNGVDLTLFPAASGNLKLLAAGSINNDGQPYSMAMSQSDPTQVPSALTPMSVSDYTGVADVPLPQQPLHQNDAQPISIVANTGNIGSGDLVFPKAANVIAGGNITDLNYAGSNLNPSDVTLIAAGGDVDYSTPTQAVTNALLPNTNGIELAGPGHLEVLAGGSINLGDSNGILTTGSLSDNRLPVTGASLVAGAGLGTNANGGLRQPAYQNFTATYLAPNATTGAPSTYASTLIGYMQGLNPTANANLTYAAALTSFEALTPAQQLPLLAQVLSDELSATGLAHTLQGASYARGYAAINTLFPATAGGQSLVYDGNLNMAFSQLKTEQGGDIDLLVPGGSVVVGFANPPASLSLIKQIVTSTLTVPAEVNLGILVLGQGAIQGFADQDFTVNQSRILTLEGGDIILWASNGNIDAGKGAKSASGAPPPVISTDANGNLFVNPSNSVSGSGIGQLLTVPGIKAGLVNLIAPKGDVNAGDAGIRVAGNLNIAAVQVIGAGNITVVGTATGVPVSEAGAFAGALSGANALGDASKNAVDQLSQDLNNAANYQELSDSLTPSFIVVKMFCLGIECETN